MKKTNKLKRLEDYYKSNWPQPPEEPSEHERNALRATWEPLLEKPLFDVLFPEKVIGLVNQDSVMGAVAELLSILNNAPTGATSGCTLGPKCSEIIIQHTDLMLKWVALAFAMRESSNGLLQLLLLVATIFDKIKNTPNLQLHEGEVVCILPALIDKSGHKSERHKFAFKAAIKACTAIVSANRMCQLLLGGLTCKNKKTRVVCIEEIDSIVAISGSPSLGKVGIREISSTLNNKNTDVGVRNAALDFCFTLYKQIGYDRKILTKMLGDVSERAVPMIDHRIKEKMKTLEAQGQGQDSTSIIGKDKDKIKDSKTVTEAKKTQSTAASSSVPATKQQSQKHTSTESKVTTPVVKSSAFVLEDDDAAFRLEMTPPETEAADHTSRYTASAGALTLNMGGADTLPPPPSSVVTTSTSIGDHLVELDAVYLEIMSTLDVVLSSERSSDDSVQKSVVTATDHLKMLHKMIDAEKQPEPGKETYEILQRHAPALISKLNGCIDFGFQFKSSNPIDSKELSDLVDVSFISVSLTCMFALLECRDLLRYLNESKVTEMLSTGIRWLVDTRFFPSEGSSLAPKVEQDLSQALNAFLIKIGSSRPFKNGVVICSIIDVLSECVEEKPQVDNSLPSACAKPLSRLLLKVLSNEASRGSTKAFHLPNVDTMRVMSVLHSFFNSHPSTVPNNDIPYCCAKTVLGQLIEALGSSEIDRLCAVLKIPQTAFVYQLSKRLAPDSEDTDSGKQGSIALHSSPTLLPELVKMIETITSARDKGAAIGQLRRVLKKDYPEVDIAEYLQHTSSYFRNFVLDTLTKLESGNGEDVHTSSMGTTTQRSPIVKTADGQVDGNGTEALRILEGLKSTSKRSILASPLNENVDRVSGGSAATSRSQFQDKIKGTLNSVSASLSMDLNINSEEAGGSSAVSTKGTSSSSGCGADSDLAARLARLKRMDTGS